jgi:transcriptional regulator with XRE-family HTH domain
MKRTQTLRGVLGISQEDVALILKVSRTSFAKYEAGNRTLSQPAMLLLSEMIQYMCDEPSIGTGLAEQHIQKLKVVQRMQKENEYQQEATARKIKYVEEKSGDYLKALQLVEFLSQRTVAKDSDEAAMLRTISRKASQGLKTQGLDKLFQLELKLEMLQTEKLLLDYEVIKTMRVLENTGSK